VEHNISVGMTHEFERVVTKELSAEAVGSGNVAVFATPIMIAFMERAAEQCVINGLAEGCGTVGTVVNIEHCAATPLGMKVSAKAILREIDGRRLVFDVEAHDEKEIIGRGVHERVIIQKEKFMARVNSKNE